MLAEENNVLRQLELTIKKAAFKIRKDGEFDSGSLMALAKLSKEYRELLFSQQTIGDEIKTENGYHELLESPDGPPICDPSKNKILKKKGR